MYSDTLELDILFDVPARRPALFSRETFDVPVRPMDTKGLINNTSDEVVSVKVDKKICYNTEDWRDALDDGNHKKLTNPLYNN